MVALCPPGIGLLYYARLGIYVYFIDDQFLSMKLLHMMNCFFTGLKLNIGEVVASVWLLTLQRKTMKTNATF